MAREKPHGAVSEQFMRHHYGASGYAKKTELRWQDSFEAWWRIHASNYPEQKSFARWIWSAAWNERSGE